MNFALELKSSQLNALILRLNTDNWQEAELFFKQNIKQYQPLYNIPIILDLNIFEEVSLQQLIAFIHLLQQHHIRIIAIWHKQKDFTEFTKQHHLFSLKHCHIHRPPSEDKQLTEKEKTTIKPINCVHSNTNTPTSSHELKKHTIIAQNVSHRTIVIDTPIRTGQQVYAENADLIVLGMVSEGAEVMADGNIHIYAPMRGRALAGEKGDNTARIFIQSMQAELVSIAGIYRVFEHNLPPHLHKKAVRIELQDNKLAVSAINL